MIAPAVDLVTYVGHYVVARLLYDDLVRPLTRGDISVALVLIVAAALAFGAGRRSRRRT